MIREIAVIADLHGNVPAVQALEIDLNRRSIGTVYCRLGVSALPGHRTGKLGLRDRGKAVPE